MSTNDDILADELFAAVRAKAQEARRRASQLGLAAEEAADQARAADEAIAILAELRDDQGSFNAAARRFLES